MNTMKKDIGKAGIVAIMLMSSLTVMVGNAITPALPELGKVFGLGNFASWLVTAPALGVVVTSIFFGKLIDKVGPYKVGVAGLFFYGLTGVLGAFMPNAVLLFIDRFLLGAATATIMSSGVTLIAGFFQGEMQLKILAIQGMSMEFGGVVFLGVAGFLADFTWKAPFFIYALGFLALLMILIFIPAIGPISENNDDNNNQTNAKGVPLALVLLIAFLGMLMFFTAMVSLPIYLQNNLGYSPSFTGYYLAVLDLIAVLAAGFMPKIVAKIKAQGCLTIAFICYALAYILYFISPAKIILAIAVVFMGLGFGLSTPLFNSLVVSKSAPEKKGINASLCTMAMFTGQFLSAMLVSFISGLSLFITASSIAIIIGICILPVSRYFAK